MSAARALAVPLDAVAHADADGAGWLLWRVRGADTPDHGFARGGPPDGCLDAFLALEQAPLAEFPAFARRWGVLGVCAEHDLPGAHAACAPRRAARDHDRFPRVSLTEGWTAPLRVYREPVSVWRAIAARMARGEPVDGCPAEADASPRADAFARPARSLWPALLAELEALAQAGLRARME